MGKPRRFSERVVLILKIQEISRQNSKRRVFQGKRPASAKALKRESSEMWSLGPEQNNGRA